MKKETTILYKGIEIYLNKWGEYCILNPKTGYLFSFNSCTKTLKDAKKSIDGLNQSLTTENLEKYFNKQ